MANINDFDVELQTVLNNLFSNIPKINWKNWFSISTKEEYENFALGSSGLSSVEDIFQRIKEEKTDPKQFSINVNSFLKKYSKKKPVIFCHTSGTSSGDLSNLKWYHLSNQLIENVWAPGMQAIFESSGLDSKKSGVIFVPSRIKHDGLNTIDNKQLISLYSAEFSQRLMLSLIRPDSYLLDQYKNSNNLEIIAKILSMEEIAIISAPALTILKWADLFRFRQGLEKSLNITPNEEFSELTALFKLIERSGLEKASLQIQNRLSEKLSKATIVFSISSLSPVEWALIRNFMNWKKGEEKFTNLYVASETGPFSASINEDSSNGGTETDMYLFPLTIPVIKCNGNFELISRTKNKIGKLYVSRVGDSGYYINIDTGDVITIKSQDGLPKISDEILRADFQFRMPIKLSPKIDVKKNYEIRVGSYFKTNGIEIINPGRFLKCLGKKISNDIESSMLTEIKNNVLVWKISAIGSTTIKVISQKKLLDSVSGCPHGDEILKNIKNKKLRIEFIDFNPIEMKHSKSEIIQKIRAGILPKGALKRWPLYFVKLVNSSE